MYIEIPSNISKKKSDEEFRKAIARLKEPARKPDKIFSSRKVDIPKDVDFELIPHFKECVDKDGNFSKQKYNEKLAALKRIPNS